MDRRDQLFRFYRHNPSTVAWDIFKAQRNRVVWLQRKAKMEYFHQLLCKKSHPSHIWNTLKLATASSAPPKNWSSPLTQKPIIYCQRSQLPLHLCELLHLQPRPSSTTHSISSSSHIHPLPAPSNSWMERECSCCSQTKLHYWAGQTTFCCPYCWPYCNLLSTVFYYQLFHCSFCVPDPLKVCHCQASSQRWRPCLTYKLPSHLSSPSS